MGSMKQTCYKIEFAFLKKNFFSLLPWYFSPIQNLEINVVSIIGEGVRGYKTLHRGSAI